MSDINVPFYTQAALLDNYIHAKDPSSDPEMVKLILEILRTKKDLRSYFFRSSPSVPWAKILWENGFFSTPPEPTKTEGGFSFIPWDVQYYLISIAPQVQEIVIDHVKTIHGHGWYLARAIEALCKVPVEKSERVLPIIFDWLQDITVRDFILDESILLMKILIKEERWESALKLFAALSTPKPGQKINTWSGTNFLQDNLFGTSSNPVAEFEIIKNKEPESVIRILEKNLIDHFSIGENENTNPRPRLSWWRNAIEDTDQDILNSYEDLTLRALRETLVAQVSLENQQAKNNIVRYLRSPYSIFRRLGLFLLWKNKNIFADLASTELLKLDNLYEVDIHHEYFLLLEHCFTLLSPANKKILVNMILNGPDENSVRELADWAEKEHQANRREYVLRHKKLWIRDRLWMIRNSLNSREKKILDNLISEYGEPEHPAFLTWSTGMFSVMDISPFPEKQLSDASPDELFNLLSDWRPNPRDSFGPERISYEGIAMVLSNLVIANPRRYSSRLCDIALLRPEYSSAIIGHWGNSEYKGKIPWRIALNLCEGLLANPIILTTEKENISDRSWIGVRLSIISLIEVGISNKGHLIPKNLLPKARNILLQLVDDPDPSLEDDRPTESHARQNDFITMALNHVRPRAISILIRYAIRKALLDKIITKKIAMEKIIRELLTCKVNTELEPSRAVHSVFGQYLPNLYWLDKKWVEQNLESIFPLDQDAETIWFFISAWNGYILNRYNQEIFSLLRSRYKQAIRYISEGYTTQSHLELVGRFSIHLALDYYLSEIEQKLPFEQDSLIVDFVRNTIPDVRSKIGWALWLTCKDNPKDLINFWPKAKLFWEWRTHEATRANHSPEFSLEMGEYSQLLLVAPPYETITTLRHLLEGLLPYMQGAEYRNQLWNCTEKFLSNQVERDSVNSIKFYRLMFEQKNNPPRWLFHSDEAKKIIEISAKNPKSRVDALSLIDFLARWGDDTYRSVYESYSV